MQNDTCIRDVDCMSMPKHSYLEDNELLEDIAHIIVPMQKQAEEMLLKQKVTKQAPPRVAHKQIRVRVQHREDA